MTLSKEARDLLYDQLEERSGPWKTPTEVGELVVYLRDGLIPMWKGGPDADQPEESNLIAVAEVTLQTLLWTLGYSDPFLDRASAVISDESPSES